MIEMVFNGIFPVTFVLVFLLLGHKVFLTKLGANTIYRMWCIVPLSLVFYVFVPKLIATSSDSLVGTQLEGMVISSRQATAFIADVNWVVAIYTLVSAAFILFSVLNHMSHKLKLYRFQAGKLKPQTQIDVEALGIQLPKNLTIVTNRYVQTPMIFGFVKPQLILPPSFSNMYNAEQQKLILEHEICHFGRNDIYWNLIAYGLVTLFWFHPLVWLAYFRFRQDQELSCDQTVLARKYLNSRINYSRALLITAQYKPSLLVARISFNEYGDKNIMLERINQIKSLNAVKKSHKFGVIIAGGLLLSGISYAGGVGSIDSKMEAGKTVNKVSPIMRIEPKYPSLAAKNNVEGAVLLKFDISANGDTQNIRVVTAKPADVFDQSAINALSQWKYSVSNNKASKDYLVQLDFRMDKTSSNKAFHLVERINVSQ